MKHKVCLLIALACLTALPVKAYDFAVRLNYGDSLFFNVTDAVKREVKVVPPNAAGINYYAGHRQPSGVLNIPESVEYGGQSYTVTAIGERAFSGCTSIGAVTIPPTVTTIEPYAFYGCTGLRGNFIIGENIRSIGSSAFYGCSSITDVVYRAVNCTTMGGSMSMTAFGNCRSLKHVRIAEGVKVIPEYAFCGLDGLTDSIKLPSSLETIGAYAFAYCNSISGRMVIPDKVATIGECAFHQCHSLTSLVIGSSVKYIGGRAFYHCHGLKQVVVKTTTPPFVASTTFSETKKGIPFSVPCVSKKLYNDNPDWSIHAPFSSYGNCSIQITATSSDRAAAQVVGGGKFDYGDSVILSVYCQSGYGFEGWSDGAKENPRRFVATGSMQVEANVIPLQLVTLRDTVYDVDTVYREGYKVIHDTVDLVEESTSINKIAELTLDKDSKVLSWQFSRREKVVSVILYNQLGECVYYGDGRKGAIDMSEYSSGPYIIRVETVRRVLRSRFFLSSAARPVAARPVRRIR